MQQLLLKGHLELFQKLGRQENSPDPIFVVRYFCPWSNWTWYVSEFDPQTGTCFGFIIGQSSEWGYFSLLELQDVTGPWGLKVERDIHFNPTPFSQIRR